MRSIKDLKFNGAIKSMGDSNVYKISRFVPKVDEVKDEEFCFNLPKREIILNQTVYSDCVAHAYALGVSVLEYQLTGKWIEVSPGVIYGTRYPDDNYYGEGMYTIQGAKPLHKDGAFLRRDFEERGEMPQIMYRVNEFKAQHPFLCQEAKERAIEGYALVSGTRQIKQALKHKMVVIGSWDLYESFYDVDTDGVVTCPTSKEIYIGAHAMLIVGWTSNRQWIVLNSWGTDCGMKGVYLIPFEYTPFDAVAISDTITPSKKKAKEISMAIGIAVITVDGMPHVIDAAPIIEDNRTFAPARFVAEYLGASVEWDGNEKKVTIRSEEAEIIMRIGNRDFVINGKKYRNDVAPFITGGRTLVPIRIISENLNCEVEWDKTNETVKIKAL